MHVYSHSGRSTPRRSPRIRHTPNRTGLTPRGLSDDDPLGIGFDQGFFMFEDMIGGDASVIEVSFFFLE